MASDDCAKILLIIAGVFGLLQGLLTFIGGLATAFDSNKNVVFKSYCSSIMTYSLLHGVYFVTSSLSGINLI